MKFKLLEQYYHIIIVQMSGARAFKFTENDVEVTVKKYFGEKIVCAIIVKSLTSSNMYCGILFCDKDMRDRYYDDGNTCKPDNYIYRFNGSALKIDIL